MDDAPEPTKLTRTKRRWAEEGRFLTGQQARPEADRLPPGQHLVRDWPVLDLGQHPSVANERWQLRLSGLVERPVVLDWKAFLAMPQHEDTSDIHCVTTWSRYDNRWLGVATVEILDLVQPQREAAFVLLRSYDGYTTNLPLADFAASSAILAHQWEKRPLTREHGGPVRLIVPHLYFWKSAKWINGIEFLSSEQLGFWEVNGYHRRGDPWVEERYSAD